MLRREQSLIALLCFAGALRVFLFAAAFPFFSNGDEDQHFDLIVQYSDGYFPRTFDVLKSESLEFIANYASPEFLQTPDNFADQKFPAPLWKQSPEEAAPVIEATKAAWKTEINWESSQPPLYYMLAGFWWKVGQSFGLRGIQSLYWIRFLNALLLAFLVWLGFVTARTVAPQCLSLRLGTALLLAFIPQDVFYVMSNDVLSPICFGAVFLCLLRWFSKSPTPLLGAATGLGIAATYLTKLSNLPLLVVVIIAIIAHSFVPFRKLSASTMLALILMALCAAIPVSAWMIWSRIHFGDITGSTTKMALLDWTRKPFINWWQHPIFSFKGLWEFWSTLLARFWRGELMWQNRELSSPLADNFYAISSLIFIVSAITGIRSQRAASSFQSKGLLLAAFAFLSAIGFFFLLSIQFDFGRCIFPSRAHPYFTSGRLMSGALIPFALLYCSGVVRLLRPVANRVPAWAALILIVAVASISETLVKRDVFFSEHNWFHL
jgi:hypothetical protein